eukprot:c14225_g1_i1 orf=159-650(+)
MGVNHFLVSIFFASALFALMCTSPGAATHGAGKMQEADVEAQGQAKASILNEGTKCQPRFFNFNQASITFNLDESKRNVLYKRNDIFMMLNHWQSLLQDHSPVLDQRFPSPKGGHKRRLLQDYSPMANQSNSTPKGGHTRKLLQDYTPTVNQRTPSLPKVHKL